MTLVIFLRCFGPNIVVSHTQTIVIIGNIQRLRFPISFTTGVIYIVHKPNLYYFSIITKRRFLSLIHCVSSAMWIKLLVYIYLEMLIYLFQVGEKNKNCIVLKMQSTHTKLPILNLWVFKKGHE